MLDRSETAPDTDPESSLRDFPTGEVVFLMTDIEGSTRLWDRAPKEMRRALECHDDIIDSAIDDAGGYVFCRAGDSFAAAFTTAEAALHAAAKSQRLLAAQQWPGGLELRVRMAIHVGEADERDGNYFGPCLNRCSRLLGVCDGGMIAMSEMVRERIGAHIASILDLTDLGLRGLRDLEEPEHVWYFSAGAPESPDLCAGEARDSLIHAM